MIPVLAPGERVLVHYGAPFSNGDIVLPDADLVKAAGLAPQ